MSDAVTAAVAGAATGAAGGLAIGLPNTTTVVCGLVGAVVSVWVSHGEAFELTTKWFGKVIGLTALYFLVGLFSARGIITAGAGSGYDWARSLAQMPEWVLCGGIALGAAYLLPILGERFKALVGSKT